MAAPVPYETLPGQSPSVADPADAPDDFLHGFDGPPGSGDKVYDYDPVTMLGNPSTPIDASRLSDILGRLASYAEAKAASAQSTAQTFLLGGAGQATVTAGQTSVVVNHGISTVPTVIFLNPVTDTLGARWRVSARTATTFTISLNAAQASDITFDWTARLASAATYAVPPSDPAAGVPGLRSLGTGAQQAAAGTAPAAAVAAIPSDPVAATPGLRSLGTTSTKAMAGNDSRVVNLPVNAKDAAYGAVGDGVADDTAALQAALTAAAGKTLFIPAGTYKITSTLTIPTAGGINIRGAGMGQTVIDRTSSDIIALDLSGASNTVTAKNIDISDLSVNGAVGSTRSSAKTLIRAFYGARLRMHRVQAYGSAGCALEIVQLWDSYFNECRFDFAGSTDGTIPALLIANRTSDTSGVMGYSTDSCNQITFNDCVLESGAANIFVRRNARGATGNTKNWHTIGFHHVHQEPTEAAGPLFSAGSGFNLNVDDRSYFFVSGWASGWTTVSPVVELGSASIGSLQDSTFQGHVGWGSIAQYTNCAVQLGSTTNVEVDV
jgi:hypothetical protein